MGRSGECIVEVYVPQLSKRLDLKLNVNMRIEDLITQIHRFVGSKKGPGVLAGSGECFFYDPGKTVSELGIRTGERVVYWF
ncbi:MAG: hypothetical protein K6G22_05260 [Lachnospiraceae bacterium]|nr:hypothetical protein [Lachnospiraceae bacterium]